jgi:hypothetical protein
MWMHSSASQLYESEWRTAAAQESRYLSAGSNKAKGRECKLEIISIFIQRCAILLTRMSLT